MNGSNKLEEADRKPFALCPVCLRKLKHYIKFSNIAQYHTKLLNFISDLKNPMFDREQLLYMTIIRELSLMRE